MPAIRLILQKHVSNNSKIIFLKAPENRQIREKSSFSRGRVQKTKTQKDQHWNSFLFKWKQSRRRLIVRRTKETIWRTLISVGWLGSVVFLEKETVCNQIKKGKGGCCVPGDSKENLIEGGAF